MVAEKTNNTLTERPIFIRIGLLFFIARPLTLAQLWKIGSIVEDMPELELEDKFNPMAKVLERFNDFKTCTEVFINLLFRSSWTRFLFGWYIRKNLTAKEYYKLLNYATESFQPGFFLTNLTFLKGIKTMTSPTNTDEATRRGDSSEG